MKVVKGSDQCHLQYTLDHFLTMGIIKNSVVSATEKADAVFDRHFARNNIHRGRFKALMPPADVTDTAKAIITATSRRQRELYFPSNHNLFLTSLIRILCPDLLEYQIDSMDLRPGETNWLSTSSPRHKLVLNSNNQWREIEYQIEQPGETKELST